MDICTNALFRIGFSGCITTDEDGGKAWTVCVSNDLSEFMGNLFTFHTRPYR
jgi:hypothetical protein